ncbi:MAG TPA: 16S rRNA (cytosine(967)-C(5))-methyltransferase RsmB [Chthoniobacterales bacterium]|nr:16S rRNA (cytosine(967)-C(5))-methyltransferase RsmB [Chthoniobacterales bacterium]
MSARGVALAALGSWRRTKQFADSIIPRVLERSNMSPSDRAFAMELFYGVLRNLTLLDFWIANLRKGHLDSELRDVLRMGLYQLFMTRTPEHAAVNETVELVSKHKRSIVNAVLRSAGRERDKFNDKTRSQPLEVRASHPKFLIERWQSMFGPEAAERLCEWDNQPPSIYARINRLRIDIEEFRRRYPETAEVTGKRNFVRAETAVDLKRAIASGHCYIQDPSTAVACELVQPQAGEKVLDACAAPGGKTSYLAELMQNQGFLLAADRDPERLKVLGENLRRLGGSIATIVRQDWTKRPIAKEILSHAPFDRILIDAPCSNTGVMRRRVDVRWRLRPADFLRMQKRQIEIVRAVLPLLKSGGILVYSTCSLEPEENEWAVESLLCEKPVLQLEEQRLSLPFRDGFDGAFAAKLRRQS